ncbi:MAG: chromosome partitioning protein ParB, partial [Pseudomonadota bacterium]
DRVVAQGLSVRQTERLAKAPAVPDGTAIPPKPPVAGKDTDTRLLEGDLSAAIGMRAQLFPQADGAGELRIRYRDFDELDRLCEKLTR